MRIVVVGATGNIGTSLVQRLADDEAVTSVLGLARRLPGWQPPGTTWAAADVTTDDLVAHFRGADVVVHLAWAFQPAHRPHVTWHVNVGGSARVFAAAAEAGVGALVYSSSVGAYSPGDGDVPVDESWPTHGFPTAGYGREKAYVERLLDSFEQAHASLRVVRLRPGFIFKRRSASEQHRLFVGPLVPRVVLGSRLVPLLPDLPGLRLQALHAADAADAFALAALRPVRGAFNVAADPVIGAAELADVMGARAVRLPRSLVRNAVAAAWHLRLTPASPHLLDLALALPVMDTSRARDELGWRPTYTAREALVAMFEGMRRREGLDTPPLAP